MKDLIAYSTIGLAILTAIVLAAAGWVMNLLALVHLIAASAPVDILLVARAVGLVFAPLGIALGWFA